MGFSRSDRLRLNTVTSLFFQIMTIICGFVVPRLIIRHYGSQVNGLVNSVTQFLHIITFLELGVGAVVQSSLYKPIARKDKVQVSRIICSAGKFFSKIAFILLMYVALLVVVYPIFVNSDFDSFYTGTLIIAISISSFAQYYFGVVDRLFLSAVQQGYIQYTAQTLTLILNTLACAMLIQLGASIQVVKLTTSIIYLLRPVFLRLYINKHYDINRRIKYTGEPIKQKWNGIAQHVAAVILDQTDVIVLTLFSSLTNVSIYSVYNLVIYGVKNLFLSLTNGFQALIGDMLAKGENEELKRFFCWTEWLLHTGTILVFGCTAVLLVPFVSVYTRNVTDANYIVPVFSLLITIAHAGHCLRLPYNILILAAGHYKQTQTNYIVAAVMNVGISIILVRAFGLIGVATGTLCAMIYQTIWMAFYDSKHIINYSMKGFAKHSFVDAIIFITAFLVTNWIPLYSVDYLSWVILAVIDFLIWVVVSLIINYFAYKEYVIRVFSMIFALIYKKKDVDKRLTSKHGIR